ncbi:hypothetical protein ACSSNL_06910 [Thalassobius sp. S69A]|uniref:hypothetical protein n=1 Tax=unclassified Thalassovita TaxID=2619711 RepID=UPI000C0F2962|nr:hypothetical protein [Paracoccaceae bacterium]MBT24837.1 hypothetical protein [Paracoccaceae bacterium]
MSDKVEIQADHSALMDTRASRRYFAKFGAITQHVSGVIAQMHAQGKMSADEADILARYLVEIGYSFRALSMKYLLVGRDTGQFFGSLSIDTVDSGFPTFNELLVMANDAMQASRHLDGMPPADALKKQMVQKIVGAREIPTKLQFALSQRLYYEELAKGHLFWARNDPRLIWLSGMGKRRRYLAHWAVYDSQLNLPVIYVMEFEDTGREALPKDERRWPEMQAHLMGQSLGGLKLLTIARGFDEQFNDLHPKRLRRIHLGPMYSHSYTRQSGPLREVLAEAGSPEGQDWALAWTMEELESERVTEERVGWFSSAEREVFALDPFGGRGVDTGATRTERSIIMPERPYQVLAEKNPPGFASVRKYVVSDTGRVLSF